MRASVRAVSGDIDGASLSADCVPHDLAAVIDAIVSCERLDARALDAILRRHPKHGRGFWSKRDILRAFRREPGRWPIAERAFAEKLRTCPTRSLSGVLPVTVLTAPFPCPGRCVFCPSDVRMPKSYLADEPGCQRAAQNRFDPYLQTWNRLAAYHEMGHPTAKVELLVLGGTWSAYPEPYQCWFVSRCFEALNDFGAGIDRRAEAEAEAAPVPPAVAPAAARGRYNALVAGALRGHGASAPNWERVARAHAANERAGSRCVGLVLETRPDEVTPVELLRLRRLGATKLQLGAQSLDDAVLAANRRGHDAAATRRAVALARGAGFKLLLHWMPNLLGATPASDRADFARLFGDPALRPDELKIYPCSLVETAELVAHHARGEWRPYDEEALVDLLADCLERVPAWCRVARVVRDIPSPDIVAGNRHTNLRETAEARVAARGGRLREIRAREVRGAASPDASATLLVREYDTAVGREAFLEAAAESDRIAGFLRLALPRAEVPVAELSGAALVRELHVYGASAELSERSPRKAQHAGLGTRLVHEAARLARDAGHARLSVISAVGTRDWWRRLGFSDGALYQHLAL